MSVVVCGAGAIGASIAYFLSLKGIDVTVVERTGVACAASGKSGGFLALDWCDSQPLGPLARRSFALHETLAAELGGDWGYRRLDTLGVVASAVRPVGAYRRERGPGWLSAGTAVHGRLGTTATTAQVIPGAFTAGLMAAAEARGAVLRKGAVTAVVLSPDGTAARGVLVDGEPLEADAVVIAMGPWSVLACRWLPLPPVFGLKGHGIVFRTADAIGAEALFVEFEDDDGTAHAPEVFPRPDGTTYVCGLSSDTPLPEDPGRVAPDPGACERLREICARIAPVLGRSDVVSRGSCYRPVARDALPLIGPVPGVAGAYVATGHNVWGILNAPATGEAMAGADHPGGGHHRGHRPLRPRPPADPAPRGGAGRGRVGGTGAPSHLSALPTRVCPGSQGCWRTRN